MRKEVSRARKTCFLEDVAWADEDMRSRQLAGFPQVIKSRVFRTNRGDPIGFRIDGEDGLRRAWDSAMNAEE